MGGELWAIIGVVVGAVIPGGIGLAQAALQRQWSLSDRGAAWEQEKMDRLYEAKRSAHEAFAGGLNRARGIVLNCHANGTPPGDDPGFPEAMTELMHLQARLYLYASQDSSEAGGDVADLVVGTGEPADFAQMQTEYAKARARYLYLARVDMEADVDEGQHA